MVHLTHYTYDNEMKTYTIYLYTLYTMRRHEKHSCILKKLKTKESSHKARTRVLEISRRLYNVSRFPVRLARKAKGARAALRGRYISQVNRLAAEWTPSLAHKSL